MTDAPNIALLWVDIETTGLDYENDLIIEMAWQMTTYLGEPLHDVRSYITIDHEDEELLSKTLERYLSASPIVQKMHLDTGLWNDVLFRPDVPRANFYQVLDHLYTDLDEHRGDAEVRFAGSTVGFDKRFLETVNGDEFPISHRVHDLSTLRPFMKWQGFDLDDFVKDYEFTTHRAAADIERDILQWRGLVSILTEET